METVCVCVRACGLFGAHAHSSVASRSAVPCREHSGSSPLGAGPCQPRTRQGGSPQSRQGSLRAGSVLGTLGAEEAPERSGVLGTWSPSSRPCRAPSLAPAPRDSPASARRAGLQEEGGARRPPGPQAVTESDSRRGSWSPARTPDPPQMETVSPREPAGILRGISPGLCLLAHFTKAAFTTLRQGRLQMEQGSWWPTEVSS